MLLSLRLVFSISRLMMAATFFSGCVIVGLFTSSFFRVLPSIGMAGVLLAGCLSYVLHKNYYARASSGPYIAFVTVYLLHVISGLLIKPINALEYQQDLVLQLPFLVLPLGFWLLPPLPTRNIRFLWLLLIGVTFAAALLSTGYYLLHWEYINELYLRSKVMPTEPDHIRFSLIITLAIAVGSVLLINHSVKNTNRSWLLIVLVALVFYQHLLAVRSGLLTFYALAGLAILVLIFRNKQYRQAGYSLVALLVFPLVSYICFPTFRNKSVNTREDVGRVEHTASANNYSLVGRVYSYKVAIKVVKQHPLFGVGKTGIEPAMAVHYQQDYPNIRPDAYIQPHNQYLYTLVAFGAVGVILFVIGFYYAGLSVWPRSAPLLFAQYIIVTLSFLVEYTLETQIGIAFSLFFLLLALEGSKGVGEESGVEWRPR